MFLYLHLRLYKYQYDASHQIEQKQQPCETSKWAQLHLCPVNSN